MNPVVIKDEKDLARKAAILARRDPDLRAVHRRLGPPPLWRRTPSLATLLQIVLEQQVSLASGRAAFQRLKDCCQGRVRTDRLIALGAEGLRNSARLTRQKSNYILAIAEAVDRGTLKIAALKTLSDRDVRGRLTALKGIGPWTADVYLLMALRRCDILPPGDIALEKELSKLRGLNSPPDRNWLVQHAERWRPYRAVAARMIWHSYLDRLGRYHEI